MLVPITVYTLHKSPVYVHPKRPQVWKPTTFLLWGNSSNHCTTMPPRIQVSHLWCFSSLRPVEYCSSKCSVNFTNVDLSPCLTHKCSRLQSKISHEYKVIPWARYSSSAASTVEHTDRSRRKIHLNRKTQWQSRLLARPTSNALHMKIKADADNLIRFSHDDCMSHVSS